MAVGANIGWFTLVAARVVGSRGRVHSFEPAPDNLMKLRASVARNQLTNVAINDWAPTETDGTEQLFRSARNLGDRLRRTRSAGAQRLLQDHPNDVLIRTEIWSLKR